MKIFHPKKVVEILSPPAATEIQSFLEAANINTSFTQEVETHFRETEGTPFWDHPAMDYILSAACWYARSKHPKASMMDVASFAGLLAYLSSGIYGGFGTEEYRKEQQAENILQAWVGGSPPHPNDMIGLLPQDVIEGKGNDERTAPGIRFLEEWYFGNQEKAVADLLEGQSAERQARMVLALASDAAQFNVLRDVAEGFLKRKKTIGDLRAAVKEAIQDEKE